MSNDLAILSSHLSTLIEVRSVSQHELDPLVEYAISETREGRSPDTRRAQWEYLLKNEIFKLAAMGVDTSKSPGQSYFEELKSRLDLVLAFTEHDMCDTSFPFNVLEDLLETQTVASCWHIFSWIEERTERLTLNMIPGKGKALVLLRALNDLLRRLSKTGKNTMFCGRILIFLSNVFSLGERSGVNLRGDYGAQWEGVVTRTKERKEAVRPTSLEKTEGEDVQMAESTKEPTREAQATEMRTQKQEGQPKASPEKTEEDKKDEFFQTFWSLQLPFSRPPLFAHTISFDSFKDSVNTVLPVIAEATKKERAMMGSKVVAGNLKRKREPSPLEAADDAGRDYFFAKFLTSPELLDLEIADTLFRRQFLFQLLILLQHLNFFTQSERAKWEASRNRSLHMDFTLSAVDAKWTQETWTKAMDELKATTPNGKAFADTVGVILEREQNWIKWKNDFCPPFDKEPIQPTVEEQTREKRRELMKPAPAWRWACGTESLTEVWETGFKSLSDLENPPDVGELKDFARNIKQKERQIEMRKKQIANEAAMKAQREAESKVAAASPETPSSQAALAQTSAPAASQAVTTSQTSPPPQSSSQPAGATPAAAATPTPVPTGPASLHPSLPPRPVASPAPYTKPQTPIRNATPSSGPAQAAPKLTPPPPPPPPKQDERLVRLCEDKDRLSWLAIRRARTEHLPHFGKIGTGDVEMLMASIEQGKEKAREREKAREKENDLKGDRSDKAELPLSQVTTAAEQGDNDQTGGEGAVNCDMKIDSESSQETTHVHQDTLPGTETSMEVDSQQT